MFIFSASKAAGTVRPGILDTPLPRTSNLRSSIERGFRVLFGLQFSLVYVLVFWHLVLQGVDGELHFQVPDGMIIISDGEQIKNSADSDRSNITTYIRNGKKA